MTKALLATILAAGSLARAAAAQPPPAKPFPVRGYHQHIFPDVQPMSAFHHRLDTLKKYGYNMAVFGMGSPGKSTITMHADGSITPNGCSTDDMRKLVQRAVDLGLEPVFEMKFIGKQIPLLREMVQKYPGLLINPKSKASVLDATFRLPDGRDAYSATTLALVDYLLGLYPKDHPAKYFFFGIDEFSAADMAALAKKLGMTPGQAFAHCVNLGTDHVLAKGVTPLVWSDTMLSPALAGEDHGLTLPGYQPDPRLASAPGGAYNAKLGLRTMVNSLRDRDKIIVVDWHYAPSPTGEFPSMDYFQRVGFKDVWGAPWHNATNIRQFAQYAARRGCGGMIATAWSDAYTPESRLRLHFIIASSSAYFHNPAIAPPDPGPAAFTIRGRAPGSHDDEKRLGFILRGDRALEFRARVTEPITPTGGRLLITSAGRRSAPVEASLTCDPDARVLAATFDLPAPRRDAQYQVRYCYSDKATGYVYLKQDVQGFMVVDKPPALPKLDPSVLLEGDFSKLPAARPRHTIWLAGACAGPLGVAGPRKRTAAAPRGGALDVQWFDRVWFLPSDYLDRELCQGMRIHIEAKMTGEFAGSPYCALFTKGSFHSGFRVLVGRDRHVLFQFARLDPKSGGPLWVNTPPGALPKGEWASVDLLYVPPSGDKPGRAEVSLNGKRLATKPVARPMEPSTAPVGIGCEFTQPANGPFGKKRPNFPGLIRRVRVRRLSVSQVKDEG